MLLFIHVKCVLARFESRRSRYRIERLVSFLSKILMVMVLKFAGTFDSVMQERYCVWLRKDAQTAPASSLAHLFPALLLACNSSLLTPTPSSPHTRHISCDIHHYRTTFRFCVIVKRTQAYRSEVINMSTASTESGPGCCTEDSLNEVSTNSRTSFEAANLTLTSKNTAMHLSMLFAMKDFVAVTMCLSRRIHVSTQTRPVSIIRSTKTPSRMTLGCLVVATKRRCLDSQNHVELRNG